jgi:hypothetical protein
MTTEVENYDSPDAPGQEEVEAEVKRSEELLDELTEDYNRLRRQKARKTGGIESRVLLNLGFVDDEQYISHKNMGIYTDVAKANHLQLVFNLIKPRLMKILGRLSSGDTEYKAQPDKKDPQAFAEAEVCDQLLRALDEKLNETSSSWERNWWMAVGGTAFVYTPWVPNATTEPMPVKDEMGQLTFVNKVTKQEVPQAQLQQMLMQPGSIPEQWEIKEELLPTGEVGCEILGPLNVFIDQSVKSIEDLSPDQRVYIAKIRTLGWVKENFDQEVEGDKDFAIVSTQFHQLGDSTGGTFLKDLIPLVQGSSDDTDPKMVVVVEAFAPPSKESPRGRYTCFVPGKVILHDEENPYEEIPLVDFHWRPVTTNFWTSDYITPLIAPQRFINKRMSQLGEQANATLYAKLLLGNGIKASDITPDTPDPVENSVSDQGTPFVQRLMPPEFPNWFMQSLDVTVKMFNDVAGGADLFQENRFPGQLRGPMAVPMLQEILDTEWGPLYQHIAERTAKVKQQRLNRVKQFYPVSRTLHYTDRTQKDDVLVFHSRVLKGSTNFNITIQRGSILPELRALREARIIERLQGPLSILYMDERTGRLDKSKIAADLKFGDTGREGREAQHRKLGSEIVSMLWEGNQQIPPVMPFYDHAVMLDELEAAMVTTEYLHASPALQKLFVDRYEAHRAFLQQEAQMQAQMMQSGNIQNAVAQATQQAAAMSAARAVDEAMAQTHAQKSLQASGQTDQMVARAQQQGRAGQPEGPPKKRTLTIKREDHG